MINTFAFLYLLMGLLFAFWIICQLDEDDRDRLDIHPPSIYLCAMFVFVAWPIPVFLVLLDHFNKKD